MSSLLGPRLSAIARRVLVERPMADVGTDHALLPIDLVLSGRVPRAIGVDLRPGPLQVAERNARAHGLGADDRLSLRRGDGLRPLAPGEVDTVVMAGMGGLRIDSLLRAAPDRLGTVRRLVLQPNTEHRALRAALVDLGWTIVDEVLCAEGGRDFITVVAEPGRGPPLSEAELQLGPVLIRRRSPAFLAWLRREGDRLGAAAAAARSGGGAVPPGLARSLAIVQRALQAATAPR